MFDYIGCFEHAISSLKHEQRYRVFATWNAGRDSFPMPFGTDRTANETSSSGARTIISAWASTRK